MKGRHVLRFIGGRVPMKRCVLCSRRIWPWKNLGWVRLEDGFHYFHPACRRALRNAMNAAANAAYSKSVVVR